MCPVVADLTDEAGGGCIPPSVKVRKYGTELRLCQAPGNKSLDRGHFGCPRVPARLLDEVFYRCAVVKEQGIRQDARRLDHVSQAIRWRRCLSLIARADLGAHNWMIYCVM